MSRDLAATLRRVNGMNAQTIKLRPEEIRCDFIRASGPGGQNVNKVATAVQLRFNARETQSLSPEIRDRLIRLAGKRVNGAGEIVIEARRFRTQQRNREDAWQRLMQLIEQAAVRPKTRRKSSPTEASNVRRIEKKKRRSGIKKLRARASDDD